MRGGKTTSALLPLDRVLSAFPFGQFYQLNLSADIVNNQRKHIRRHPGQHNFYLLSRFSCGRTVRPQYGVCRHAEELTDHAQSGERDSHKAIFQAGAESGGNSNLF